jgi:hypothetical protein
MILTQFAHKALSGMAFAIIFVRAIAVPNRLGQAWHDCSLVRLDERGAHPLLRRGD